jgi:tetratricopeptide (TPR) repeat protein
MNQVIIKIKEGIAEPRIVRFLMIFGVMEAALMLLCSWTGGALFTLTHALLFSLVGVIPLSILCLYVIEKAGSGIGAMLSGWSTRPVDPRQTLAADLEKARYSKREGRSQEALIIINGVLDIAPDFLDALYLKARILWEGFGNREGAAGCLRKVMGLVHNHETLHRWASHYLDEVTGMDKRRQTH